MERPWTPLLTGALRERAVEAAQDIVEALPDPGILADGSLAGGEAGLAILAEYATRAELGEFRGTAHDYLVNASRWVSHDRHGRGLFVGATGVAWAVEHLREPHGEDGDSGVDADLIEALADASDDSYDLVKGLSGIGIYALERTPIAWNVLRRVVELLTERIERTPLGATLVSLGRWAQRPDGLAHPERYYNLGLAHGVPGALGLLGLAAGAGIEPASQPLGDLLRWLLAHEVDDERSRLPAWVVPGAEDHPGRTAWCYGDPGASAALIVAGRAANLPAAEEEGLRLAAVAAARAEELSGVRDGSLCHGAAGLMHLFNRLSQTTGDEALREAARRWAERLLAMRRAGEGLGGFLTFRRWGEKESFVPDPGVLTGAAGIALALLAAATDVDPEWDRSFLLSARRHGEPEA